MKNYYQAFQKIKHSQLTNSMMSRLFNTNKNIYRLHKKIYLNSLFAQRLQAKSLKNTHSYKIQTNY